MRVLVKRDFSILTSRLVKSIYVGPGGAEYDDKVKRAPEEHDGNFASVGNRGSLLDVAPCNAFASRNVQWIRRDVDRNFMVENASRCELLEIDHRRYEG